MRNFQEMTSLQRLDMVKGGPLSVTFVAFVHFVFAPGLLRGALLLIGVVAAAGADLQASVAGSVRSGLYRADSTLFLRAGRPINARVRAAAVAGHGATTLT